MGREGLWREARAKPKMSAPGCGWVQMRERARGRVGATDAIGMSPRHMLFRYMGSDISVLGYCLYPFPVTMPFSHHYQLITDGGCPLGMGPLNHSVTLYIFIITLSPRCSGFSSPLWPHNKPERLIRLKASKGFSQC